MFALNGLRIRQWGLVSDPQPIDARIEITLPINFTVSAFIALATIKYNKTLSLGNASIYVADTTITNLILQIDGSNSAESGWNVFWAIIGR